MAKTPRFVWRRLRWLWLDSNYQFSEFVSACVALMLGIWILLPFGFFDNNPNYAFASQFAPSWVWGIIFVGVGLTEALAVFMDWHAIHRKSSLSLFIIWMVWSGGILISNYQSPGWFVYVAWAILSLRASVKSEQGFVIPKPYDTDRL